jgi:hypothetical protein
MDTRDSASIDVVFHTLRLRRRSDFRFFHGSMSCLHVPLSTLREQPCDCPRMTRSRCGSLRLHRMALSSTPSRRIIPAHLKANPNRLKTMHSCTLRVGDGINDAPALTQASVGVAMGSGTDVARESSDIVLIGSDLTKFVKTIRIARRCHRTIMQNFVGTLVVDSIGVGLAAFGFLNPLLAAFIHVSSEMTFILNSARLLPPVPANKFVREIFSRRTAITS